MTLGAFLRFMACLVEAHQALSPTGGNKSLTLAAVYTKDAYKITTGVRYTKLGDTNVQ